MQLASNPDRAEAQLRDVVLACALNSERRSRLIRLIEPLPRY